VHGEVIWLDSLRLLWKKHFNRDDLYGLAFRTRNERCYWISRDSEGNRELDVDSMRNEQFRVMMAGLVIDLIRIYSTASDDVKFWQGLVDLLGPEKKSG